MVRRQRTAWLAGGALLLASSAAWGQAIKAQQPWTPPWASFQSRIVSCADNQPRNRVAMDDFICNDTGPINRVVFWGVVLDTDQLRADREYHIAFWSHDPQNCGPAQRLFQQCVRVRKQFVGQNCMNNNVFRFAAALNPPFQQVEGTHYWLQISEVDEPSGGNDEGGSANIGIEDWRWSSHRPILNCPAVQRDVDGQWFHPLLDACDNVPEDLAFALGNKAIVGHINIDPIAGPPIFRLELRTQDGMLREIIPVQPDEDGFFDVFPELPDGTYNVVVRGMGALPLTGTIVLQEGQDSLLDFPTLSLGDVDGNDFISLSDLALLLSNFGL